MSFYYNILSFIKNAATPAAKWIRDHITRSIRQMIAAQARKLGESLIDTANALENAGIGHQIAGYKADVLDYDSAMRRVPAVKNYDKSLPFPRDLMSEASNMRGRKYRVIIRANVYVDGRNQYHDKQFFSFYTNDLTTLSDMEQEIVQFMRDNANGYELDVRDIEFHMVLHNTDLPY